MNHLPNIRWTILLAMVCLVLQLASQDVNRNLVVNGLLSGIKVDSVYIKDSTFLHQRTGGEIPGWEINKCKGIYQPSYSFDSSSFLVTTLYNTIGPYDYEISNVTGTLCRTLTAGKKYRVSFYVKPYAGNAFSSGISVAFTHQPFTAHFFFDKRDNVKSKGGNFLGITPAFTNNTLLNNCNGFYQISFIYTAAGNENYIYIGNFKSGKPDGWKNTQHYGLWGSPYRGAQAAIYALSHFVVEPIDTNETACSVQVLSKKNATAFLRPDTIALQTINYETDDYKVREEIGWLTQKLKSFDKTDTVVIVGYTDSQGTPAYNLSLSIKRAAYIAAILKPLIPQPVKYYGMGYQNPVEEKPKSRLNRRVQVYLLKY